MMYLLSLGKLRACAWHPNFALPECVRMSLRVGARLLLI